MTIEAASTTQGTGEEERAAHALLTPEAVRERAFEIYRAGQSGALSNFTVHEDMLSRAASYVVAVIRENYPSLDVPYHSRWRHFRTQSCDLWQSLRKTLKEERSEREISRIAFDLVVVSVLLDAGAGPDWCYRPVAQESLERNGSYSRSEGLALASFDAFSAGLFSNSKADPFRCDAAALMALREEELASAFQVGPLNPLIGIEGRVALLRSLGEAMASDDFHFNSESPRIGDLFDFLLTGADSDALSARTILVTVLEALGPIWPGRIALGGINLGDTWRHSAIKRDDPTNGLVPFHKLSQWLSYSLFEPLEWAGLEIRDPSFLTGLAEYRNGGLFIDLGVIQPKDARILHDAFKPGDEVIVEWRALTVALLDLLAPLVRAELGLHEDAFPLAKVLEGGTWAAGRRIAAEKRRGGGPPISIESDGAVF